MSRTPTPSELAEKFEFVTSRAVRLKEGNAFVTGDIDDSIAANAGSGVSVVVDSFQLSLGGAVSGLTDLGAGPTSAGDAIGADLTDYAEVRFAAYVSVAGNTGQLRVRYSVGGAGSFDTLTTNTVSLATTGINRTTWEAIPALARTLISMRVYGINGDGSEDPEFGVIVAEFRK